MRQPVLRTLMLAALLSACTSESVMRPDVDVGMQTSALVPPAPIYDAVAEPLPAPSYPGTPLAREIETDADAGRDVNPDAPSVPDGPYQQDELIGQAPAKPSFIAAGFSRMGNPLGLGKQSSPLSMPADEADCRRELKRLGVTYRDLPAINDSSACQIPYPVEITGLPGRARLKPAAVLNCQMALAFSTWVKHELQPAARLRYFSGVATITQASAYSCRRMVGAGSNKMSEHSKGNALDLAKIELRSGKDILVRKKGFFAFRERGLLNTVRADGCSYFSTVLGPGYNKAHADHFHFDIMERKSGYRACR
ncbi:MAG: extensin family protein [Rhizobiaceae bacterium]